MEMIDEGWQGDSVYLYENDQFQQVLVRADSWNTAYEVALDHLPILTELEDIREAYGAFDKFADYLKDRNPDGVYEGGSPDWIRVCEFIRRWEPFFFEQYQEGLLGDEPDLQEGYRYTDNGITFAGYCERLEVADPEQHQRFYTECDIQKEDQ